MPIVARRSVRQYAWGVFWALVFVGVSYLIGMPGYGLALALLVAAGPAAFQLVRAAMGQDELLRIDEGGVLDHRLALGPIPWHQIGSAELAGNKLRIAINDPRALNLRKTVWNRMNHPIGESAEIFYLHVKLGGLDVKPKEVLQAVLERLETQR